jgi:transcriptional regulator with GAF, ATPase, and Fis domain
MTELFKDRYKIGLFLTVLFFLGIIVSLYSIYSIPSDLMIPDGYQPTFTKAFVVIGATFLIGGLAIWNALQHKHEVIVFREKKLEATEEVKDQSESRKTTISLETVKNGLKHAKDQKEILQSGLQSICKELEAGQGAIFLVNTEGAVRKVELKAGYALHLGESAVLSYEFGEGLIGQVAAGQKTIYADELPDGYIKILSGLGSASPRFLLIVPMKSGDEVVGVMEIASFTAISEDERKFVEESAQLVADRMSGK